MTLVQARTFLLAAPALVAVLAMPLPATTGSPMAATGHRASLTPVAHPATSLAASAVSMAAAQKTTVTGWRTARPTRTTPELAIGDPVRIRTGSTYVARSVKVQRRKAGAAHWRTVTRATTNATGRFTPTLKIPSVRRWEFRLVVRRTGSSTRATSKTKNVTGVAAKPTIINTWSTTPTSIEFGALPRWPIKVSGSSNHSGREVLIEARPASTGGQWGPWQVAGEESIFGAHGVEVAPPTPGVWQVRLRVLPTLLYTLYAEAVTAPRLVTMLPPACADRVTVNRDGVDYVRCKVVGYGLNFQILFTGTSDLANVSVPVLAVYFHADDEPVGWGGVAGATAQILNPTTQWALQRGYAVVFPISPNGDKPEWGATDPNHDWRIGLEVGRAMKAFESTFAATRAAYWGASGGSWFITGTFIPAGIQLAPGPVAANCGADSPFSPPKSKPAWTNIPPYETWMWLPSAHPSLRARIPILYNYGTQDFLLDIIQYSHQKYAGLGFPTAAQIWPGAMHCGHDIAGPTIAWLGRYLDG